MSTGLHILPGETYLCNDSNLKYSDGSTNENCLLKHGLIIGDQIIGKVDTDDRCNNGCKILGATGGLCTNNKCLCLNPNVISNIITSKNKCLDTSRTYANLQCPNNKNRCALKEDIQNYLDYPNIIDSSKKLNIYCGCDNDVLELYKATCPGDYPITLSEIWKQATTN